MNELTQEQKDQIPAFNEETLKIKTCTDALTKGERKEVVDCIKEMYSICKFDLPSVIMVDSPYQMAMAGGSATYVLEKAKENLEYDDMYGYIKNWYSYSDMGNMWVDFTRTLQFFRDVVKFELDEWDNFEPYRRVAELTGPRMVYEKYCIVSRRPVKIQVKQVNDKYLLDNPEGPALVWADGFAMWYLEGENVDRELVTDPQNQTIDQILSETRSQILKERVKRFSPGKSIDSGAKRIGEKFGLPAMMEVLNLLKEVSSE